MIMGNPKSIQADRHRTEPGGKQTLETGKRHGKSVRDHSPRKSAFTKGMTDIFKVFAHEGFSTRKHNQGPGGDYMPAKFIQNAEEISYWHIGNRFAPAIAPTMETMEIAAEGAFPKKVRERMALDLRMAVKPIKLKRSSFLKGKIGRSHYSCASEDAESSIGTPYKGAMDPKLLEEAGSSAEEEDTALLEELFSFEEELAETAEDEEASFGQRKQPTPGS